MFVLFPIEAMLFPLQTYVLLVFSRGPVEEWTLHRGHRGSLVLHAVEGGRGPVYLSRVPGNPEPVLVTWSSRRTEEMTGILGVYLFYQKEWMMMVQYGSIAGQGLQNSDSFCPTVITDWGTPYRYTDHFTLPPINTEVAQTRCEEM